MINHLSEAPFSALRMIYVYLLAFYFWGNYLDFAYLFDIKVVKMKLDMNQYNGLVGAAVIIFKEESYEHIIEMNYNKKDR
ncbi:hypothetical protein SAMN04487770_11270 [Butyrivibrio sp. ob235]|uniref:hypothetical protein n=1 Tax=Butyrivibrio sp. ob235 TaxID=1761780 RepID=UPI0008B21B66|nr:hypothetical protein [Butyrivibrio sp. ob235]SEL55944.1 hypothetical protein SAMN04487770_11270 [Butyrivibrio sp. ob235]